MTAADLRVCSLVDLDVEPESASLVLTDPPYPREYWPLLDDLGRLAATALRPGGSLIAMLGQFQLAEALRAFTAAGLSYRWTHACMTPGANGRFWPLKLYVGWKPMVWLTKGDVEPRRWVEDRFVSRPDKRFHGWGQDVSVFADLVRSFSARDELVVDPFLGGGTTGVAARLYGRRFLGCDVDAACVETAETRLVAVDEFLTPARALSIELGEAADLGAAEAE